VLLPEPDGPTRATVSPGAPPGEVVQRRGVGPAGSGSARSMAIAPRRSGRAGPGRRLDGRRGGEDLHQPLGGAGGPLQVAPHLRQRADAAGHDGRVEHEGRQLARREPPASTSCPPTHRMKAIAPNTSTSTAATSRARLATRWRAVAKLAPPAGRSPAGRRPRGHRPGRCGSRGWSRRCGCPARPRGPGSPGPGGAPAGRTG
jgi:hypothetical protein